MQESNPPQCFVIQPFDNGGKYDRRFAETFKPAIELAGFSAYRVDYDPTVAIPIDAIETQLKASDVCLADITERNPNVWFELGFAYGAIKDVVLICEEGAYGHYPFDVQHRRVIGYRGDSPSDFDALGKKIAERLAAIKNTQANRVTLSEVDTTSGLSPHEIAALALVMQDCYTADDGPSLYTAKREMERIGFTPLATAIALQRLTNRGFIDTVRGFDENSGDNYAAFIMTPAGIAWILANENQLKLRMTPQLTDDSIPF